MKIIYVAGPYTKGDVALNVKKAMEVSTELIKNGFIPYCPHLCHFLHIHEPQSYETWMEIGMAFLDKCDAMIRIPGESSGSDREVERAKELKIPVFYSVSHLLL